MCVHSNNWYPAHAILGTLCLDGFVCHQTNRAQPIQDGMQVVHWQFLINLSAAQLMSMLHKTAFGVQGLTQTQ